MKSVMSKQSSLSSGVTGRLPKKRTSSPTLGQQDKGGEEEEEKRDDLEAIEYDLRVINGTSSR